MMEKITAQHPDSHSLNVVNENIEKLTVLFPTIVKEGKIDVEELKALLGDHVETNDEYYRFTWAGKAMARQEANKPSTATLRPNKAESKDWDTTENIFIEGDNLEVLKLLQKSYANQIKVIYIDPPYNTGNDFVYKDNYADNLGNYLALTGQTDEDGKKLGTNSETDGRYHSNWLNMIYPRLKLARNLLLEDGIIFISIDDNEIQNLRKVCDEIFGEENFVEQIVWKKRYGGGAKEKFLVNLHEYVIMYSKNKSNLDPIFISNNQEFIDKYYTKKDDFFETKGPYRTQPLEAAKSMGERKNLVYDIPGPNGDLISPKRQWLWSKDRTLDAIEKNGLEFNKDKDGNYTVNIKQYLRNEEGVEKSLKVTSIIENIYTQHGSREIEALLGSVNFFSYPKPTALIEHLLKFSTSDEEMIIDFFAGSGTTGHAIMKLNSEDGGRRKCISIQLPELLNKESEAFEAGCKTIADITKERIRRAGEKIKAETKEDLFSDGKTLDIGFKAFKLDSSNINAWDGSVENFEQNLFNSADNIKFERTEDDVLYEILLKNGLNLTLPIATKQIADKTVYSIGAGALFICLADDISTNVSEGIGKWKEELAPVTCKVIFKDNGFSDVDKTNSIQILKRYGITEVNSI